jgi:hypothetical protein
MALVAVVFVAGACGSGTASPSTAATKPTLAFIAQMQNPSQAYSW